MIIITILIYSFSNISESNGSAYSESYYGILGTKTSYAAYQCAACIFLIFVIEMNAFALLQKSLYLVFCKNNNCLFSKKKGYEKDE